MERHHEVWAEALWVEQNKGGDGRQFIAEQIASLALADDHAGIVRWRRIAVAYDQLQAGPAR